MKGKSPAEELVAAIQLVNDDYNKRFEQVKLEFEATWARCERLGEGQILDLGRFALRFDELIAIHPFWQVWEAIDRVSQAYMILKTSFEQVLSSYGKLISSAEHGDTVDHDGIERESLHSIFQFSFAAFSLVESYYGIRGRREGISENLSNLRKREFVDAEMAEFVKKLRNNYGHVWILKPRSSFNMSFVGERRVTAKIEFRTSELLRNGDWNAGAKRFLSRSETVDIIFVAKEYFRSATRFHQKYLSETGLRFDPGYSEIARCFAVRKVLRDISSIEIVLQQLKGKSICPYDFLDRYFSAEELLRINSFDCWGREQVDYMISLRDPFGLLPESTRQKLYCLFRCGAP